jgi:hypothetical protein
MSNNTLNAALRRLGYAKDALSVSGFWATAFDAAQRDGTVES